MYTLKITPEHISKIKEIQIKNPGVANAVKTLMEDPQARAKSCGEIKSLGDYYVNAGGRHAITFNIDEEKQVISVIVVLTQNLLYEILKRGKQFEIPVSTDTVMVEDSFSAKEKL